LRIPADSSLLSLTERPGFLRLFGRESFSSLHYQSLVARRLQHLRAEAETVVEFEPASFQQMAGLVVFYNGQNHAYARVTVDEKLGRVVGVQTTDAGVFRTDPGQVPLGKARQVWLRVKFELETFRFFYALEPGAWQPLGAEMPLSFLSDEHATRFEAKDIAISFGFTGTFVGLACQDLSGARLPADFDSFTYRPG
jgi:xylan 1,4-beta-xylosidase